MSSARHRASLIALVILVSLTTGCGGDDSKVLTDTSAAGGSAGTPAAIEQAKEAEEGVEAALKADTALRAFDLEADAENDQIVIEGTVRTAEQRALAEQVATRAAGGLTVVNRVRVK